MYGRITQLLAISLKSAGFAWVNAAKLEALRAAAQVGIDDMDAGRYTTFENMDEFTQHLDTETERIINEAQREQRANV